MDDEGCLRAKSVASFLGLVPLRPARFGMDADRVPMRILDGNGEVVAQAGREVVMGGGSVRQETLRENQVLDGQTKRILFERRPRPYFLAAPEGMHMPRRR